ncbi:MAG: energy transducer TonB, partial [Gammaproteobacteria bacterium]|nr:energy transducer TonB [Gammaproteobacteria bacterium]
MRLVCPFVLAWLGASAFAQEEGEIIGGELEVVEANSLDELLRNAEDRRVVESAENIRREQEFRAQRDRQQQMLDDARAEKRRLERRGDQLQAQFDENEIRIGTLQDQYNERLGKLRELFGVLQQVAGDTRSRFDESIVSAQYPNRGEWLSDFAQRMGQATQLATIDEMEELWVALLREAVESGKVTRFTAPVDRLDGSREDTEVLRVGSFGIIDETGYVNYDWDLDRLVELGRQ